MAKYICTVCSYTYDETEGYEDGGIAADTLWKDVPDSFICPVCGAAKDLFEKE